MAMTDPVGDLLTRAQLALAAGSSDATVVRTARSLGFSGDPALRLALAAAAVDTGRDPHRQPPISKIGDSRSAGHADPCAATARTPPDPP